MEDAAESRRELLRSEFARYRLSKACVSVGLSLGLGVHSALANMHSARIVLTADEMRDHWRSSDTEILSLSAHAAGILSSGAFLFTGGSSAYRVLESVYLGLECASLGVRVIRVRAVAQARRTEAAQRMYASAAASLGFSVAETVAFMFGWWKVYFAVNVFRVSHALFSGHNTVIDMLKQMGKEYAVKYLPNRVYGHIS